MDQLIQQILDTLHAMWRRRWTGVAVAWAVCLLGGVALMAMPNRYEASARVYVDTKTVLRPLMRDLTVEPDIDQTIGLLARTLITRPNVELLVQRTKLDANVSSPVERDQLIEGLLRNIQLNGSSRDNVFTFSYRDTKPERARFVVQNLVELFLESDTGAKRRDTAAARDFIDEQIKAYESRLSDAENRLKEFKLKNMSIMDTTGRDYFARINIATDDMSKLSVELRAAEQSRDALKHELEGETAVLVPDVPTSTGSELTTEFDLRLDAQRKQLDELLRRYTEQHPDVIATRHLIARLEAEQRRALEARRRAEASAPRRQNASSSVQQQVKLALAEAEANVASLRVRLGDAQARLGTLRGQASRVPQVEAELAQLNRDYDVVRKTYENMVAKREKASLSEDVDATRSAQFRVIDPPRTSPLPVFPNRLALAPVVLLFAIAMGVAASFALAQFAPTFDNARWLRHATQRPVLGSVSMVVNHQWQVRARQVNAAFASTVGGLLVAAGIWIAWIAMHSRA